jgi:hypothetical protein
MKESTNRVVYLNVVAQHLNLDNNFRSIQVCRFYLLTLFMVFFNL